MNGRDFMRQRSRWGAVFLLVVAWGFDGVGGDVPWLFERASGRSPLQAVRPEAGLRVRTAGSVRPGEWRPGERWRIPSPAGDAFVLRIREATPVAGTGARVVGELEGDPGSEVLLTARSSAFAATVRTRSGQFFVVEPEAGGWHRVVERDPGSGPDCGNARVTDLRGLHGELREQRGRLAALAGEGPPVTNVIDIVFFHTPAAEAGAGGAEGMEALLDLAVLEANDAYARSGAHLRLRSVGNRPIAYVESGDLATDLDRLTRTGDRSIDEIHAVRDEVAADVVCLVVESEASNRLAGMANQLLNLSASALGRGFLACVRPYLVGNYTLPHEVGHTLGCDHDRDNSVGGALSAWSYGTRINVDGDVYRTVMAYRPGRQMPHFSNPDVLFHGVPTGVAAGKDIADNVRTLNQTAPLMAAVREPASRVGFAAVTVRLGEAAGRARIEVQRSGDLAPASVDVVSVDGSARAGVDFEPIRSRLELAAGETAFGVDVGLKDNAVTDGPRRWAIRLESPSTGVSVGPISQVEVVIDDDETEAAAVLDTSFRSRPGADYVVSALCVEPGGDVLAGGGFATVNGEAHPRLVRCRPDGSPDPGFVPDVKYRIQALARDGEGRIYLGGEFNTVNGVRLNHVAILAADGTRVPGFEFDEGTDFPVFAVAPASGGRCVIGGAFTTVQGKPFRHIARLLPNGQPDPTFKPGPGTDAEVRAVQVLSDDRVVIAGSFKTVGGGERPGIARLTTEGSSDPGFAPAGVTDGAIEALAVDRDGRILAAGGFRRFAGQAAPCLVRLDGRGGIDPAFQVGAGADGPILAVALAGDGSIWVAGRFEAFGGSPRRRVARLGPDGSLDPGFDPGLGPNDAVLAIQALPGGGAVIGGLFTVVNGVARGGLAAVLPTAPIPPRFTGVWGDDTLFRWTARVSPRQQYAVERSMDLQSWRDGGAVSAADGQVEGTGLAHGSGAGFVRLRRVLE